MKLCIKNYCFVIAILFTTIVYGQSKQSNLPSFTNPFQTKVQASVNAPIIPNPIKSSTEKIKERILIDNGSVTSKLAGIAISITQIAENLTDYLKLDNNNTFQKISKRTDKLGYIHTNFQQFYKGILVDGKIVMVHSKNQKVEYINGQIIDNIDIDTNITLLKNEAKSIAKNYLKVTDLINDYPIEKVITQIPTENGKIVKLTYKVRIDSYSPFEMCYIYVDVKTGEVVNKIELIAHADKAATGQTMYRGSKSITADSFSGGYRLRESSRNIQTYNATNATNMTTSGFTGASDFVSNSITFSGIPILDSFTVSVVAKSWWYNRFVDQLPDLYIKVKDSSNQLVYTSNYFNNTQPTVTFKNLGVLLTNPPYKVEVWDYDFGSSNDFGGSYNITTTSGKRTWSGGGNNGTYVIANTGNPAIDVHWGMEKTYDFYLDSLGRDSYNDSAGLIKQYLNPPKSIISTMPNNAAALNPPYNIMVYGMGDGQYMNPVVGLDVEGHEFTHMVVGNNGNGGLTYQGESGALNESFADIFGTCIEFASTTSPNWTIGEDVMVSYPNLRSLSNPNNPNGFSQQPDTYNGINWVNPNSSQDKGGVHTNSGVQNFWFYLLSQGGTGTNDLNNAYAVTGIGMSAARDIAYRNLTTYLTSTATYMDAYNGSLQAAQDLYGNPSAQYSAVRKAWYAVGIGNSSTNFCSGITELTAASGKISDGSGSADYKNNSNCQWVIAPPGATRISLTFTSFKTEPVYDSVIVYDGPNDSYPVLARWWGDSLPSVINTSTGVGAMAIKFISDNNSVDSGWTATYQAYGNTPSCGGVTVLASPTGSFSDGSGLSNYGNNQLCYWYIAPPCADSITLSFSNFDTEANYDGVIIYDDWVGTNQLAVYSGTSTPNSVTSKTGEMLVIFTSDFSTPKKGFSANYISSGAAFCSGQTTINASDFGTITAGSGNKNYCNNQNCKWLIQPPQATSITLDFTQFDVEEASTDGKSIYDAVEIYDGTSTSATLLGRFTGNNLPPSITSSGGSMLVYFYSDIAVNKQGWSANYTSTQTAYCSGKTTLTAPNDTFSDGSSNKEYANNSNCSWLIQPANAKSITLNFSAFNTEKNFDGVIVYDGATNTDSILGEFSGTSIPSSVTSSSGSMLVEFLTDPAKRKAGWTAYYSSKTTVGVDENALSNQLILYPNPSDGTFTVKSLLNYDGSLKIIDLVGKQVLKTYSLSKGTNKIDANGLNAGTYILKYDFGKEIYFDKLIIK